MKHLEESKLEESSNTIKKHSPATPRLFLGKRSPSSPRRSKNSPRFSKRSQQSLRSRKSDCGILKNKESLSVDGTQRRAKSMDEIRNNNACLSYNSASDSDCCFDEEQNFGKDVKISTELRQRKPSIDNENSYKNNEMNASSHVANECSKKSKNPCPVLEIVDVGDGEASEPFVKTSEPFVAPSEPIVKSSEQLIGNASALEINLDNANELRNDGAKRRTIEKKDESSEKKETNKLKQEDVFKRQETDATEEVGQNNKDKIKTEILQEKNKEAEKFQKEADNKVDGLQNAKKGMNRTDKMEDKRLKEKKRMKKKNGLNDEEKGRLDAKQQDESIEGESSKVGQKIKDEISKNKRADDVKERTECEENKGKEKLKEDVGRRDIKDDTIDGKDDRNIQLEKRGKNLEEEERLNVKENLNETKNKEQNSKQIQNQKRPAFEEFAKNRQEIEQDSKDEIKSHEGRETQGREETSGMNVESRVDSMDNRSKKQDSPKEHLGVNEGPAENLMDNSNQNEDTSKDRLGVNQESQENVMDNNNQTQNSQEGVSDISVTQQEGNTRTRFHGIRLEPLPDNVTKLTPPASNI